MSSSLLRGTVLAAAGFLLFVQAQAASLDMGSVDRVTNLVSYPNCVTNCQPQTLDQTVEHYLRQSLQRSGLAHSAVAVKTVNGHVVADFKGDGSEDYAKVLGEFLTDGDKAYSATLAIQKDGRWQSDWRFFLPWGLAMTLNPTIELLHFPPDYSLTGQDYLNAKTTERWGDLLAYMGVAKDKTDAYQAIVDIAPIAAPASAGSAITAANVYGDYYPYAGNLLGWWAANKTGVKGKPLVAFGAPVRDWVKTYLKLTLSVDQSATATLPNGVTVPVIGSNHPSMIFYAAYNSDGSENFNSGMKVMRQDMIAACWQADMGKDPLLDPSKVQSACTSRWTNDSYDVCMELETTIYKKTAEQAKAVCAAGGSLSKLSEPTDEELLKTERE